jgi:hypothetical protein
MTETMQITIQKSKFRLGQQVKIYDDYVEKCAFVTGKIGIVTGFYVGIQLYNQPVQEATWHIDVKFNRTFTKYADGTVYVEDYEYESTVFEEELELVERTEESEK